MSFIQVGLLNAKSSELICLECKQPITETKNYLECNGCKGLYHSTCANIHGLHISHEVNEKYWLCKKCKSESDIIAESIPKIMLIDKNETVNDLLNTLILLLNTTKSEIKDMINDISKKVANVESNQADMMSQIENLDTKMKCLTQDHMKFKNKFHESHRKPQEHSTLNSELQLHLDSFKQKELTNNVVNAGLPTQIKLKTTVSKIIFVINQNNTMDKEEHIKYKKVKERILIQYMRNEIYSYRLPIKCVCMCICSYDSI